MTLRDQLLPIKQKMAREQTTVITVPRKFAFKDHDIFDFNNYLSFFNWELADRSVTIDLTTCLEANYQAVSLLVLYAWRLRSQGCTVSFIENDSESGASAMFKRIGGRGSMSVLNNINQQFNGDRYKPLFAVRTSEDFKRVIESADDYTKSFKVEYKDTLRYVLSELLYNTLEHGRASFGAQSPYRQIPSIAQFTWYRSKNEIHFIIADVGMGIKKHIEQTYPGQESHEAAIKLAIKAKKSGTFGRNDPYINKDNAGMGLYISSSIIRRLNADMYIVSGDGLLHITPRDTTGRTLENFWPGTFVLITLRIDENPTFILHKILAESREAANSEQKVGDKNEEDERFYISISNYFGRYAEDKEAAIKFRDSRIFQAIEEGKILCIDFDTVVSSPHSFLSALLASPIKRMGMSAYKKMKIVNATPEIRETIDFILDDNT